MKIYLDDVRTPTDNPLKIWKKPWVVIRSYHDFIQVIENSFDKIEEISFDHDLGDEFTGFDCAKYLINFCINNSKTPPQTYSHSSNPVGRENIIKLINNYLVFIDKEPTSKWHHIDFFI